LQKGFTAFGFGLVHSGMDQQLNNETEKVPCEELIGFDLEHKETYIYFLLFTKKEQDIFFIFILTVFSEF